MLELQLQMCSTKPDLLVFVFMYIIPQYGPTNIPKRLTIFLRVSANITAVEINIYHSGKIAIIGKPIVKLEQYIRMSVSSNLHTSFKVCARFRLPELQQLLDLVSPAEKPNYVAQQCLNAALDL